MATSATAATDHQNEPRYSHNRYSRAYMGPVTEVPPSVPTPIIGHHARLIYVSLASLGISFINPGAVQRPDIQLVRGYMKDAIEVIQKQPEVRNQQAEQWKLWKEMALCQERAVAALLLKCFTWDEDSESMRYHEPSGSMINQSYGSIMQNLADMFDIMAIARNWLVAGAAAQELASRYNVQRCVLDLIDICTQINTRGFYDGDYDEAMDKRWENVTKSFKRLMVFCVQFMHNFVMLNEARKEEVWNRVLQDSPKGEPRPLPEDPEQPLDPTDDYELITEESDYQGYEFTGNTCSIPLGDLTKPYVLLTKKQGASQAKELPLLPRIDDDHFDMETFRDSYVTPKEAVIVTQKAKSRLLREMYDLKNGAITRMLENDGSSPHLKASPPTDLRLIIRTLGHPERGVLAGVAQILEPRDVQALPMMVQAILAPIDPAVVTFTAEMAAVDRQKKIDIINKLAFRCRMFLTLTNGKSLFKEMLVYIALWDLNETDLYFKIMAKIMRTVINCGHISDAYEILHEPQEIISSGQSVLIKILTYLFKTIPEARGIPTDKKSSGDDTAGTTGPPPQIFVDVVHYLLGVFRLQTVPAIRALISIQGQIKRTSAPRDLFPWGMLEMERNYEGFFRWMEFFVTLTEVKFWAAVLVEHELVWELVCLLKELNENIPRGAFVDSKAPNAQSFHDSARPVAEQTQSNESSSVAGNPPQSQTASSGPSTTVDQDTEPKSKSKKKKKKNKAKTESEDLPSSSLPVISQPSTPVAVERPYDTTPTSTISTSTATTSNVPPLSTPTPQTSLPLPTTAPTTSTSSPSPTPSLSPPLEALDFGWPLLKKQALTIITALAWDRRQVQDHVRVLGGLEALLLCCAGYDSHNEFLREHAIVALRVLLRGNEMNQKVIGSIERVERGKLEASLGVAAALTDTSAVGAGSSAARSEAGVEVGESGGERVGKAEDEQKN